MGSDLSRPAAGWFLALDGGIAALTVLSASRSAYGAVRSRVPVPPRRAFQALLAGTVVVHVAEAAVAYRSSRRRGSGVPGRWALQTLMVGFPSLMELRSTTRE